MAQAERCAGASTRVSGRLTLVSSVGCACLTRAKYSAFLLLIALALARNLCAESSFSSARASPVASSSVSSSIVGAMLASFDLYSALSLAMRSLSRCFMRSRIAPSSSRIGDPGRLNPAIDLVIHGGGSAPPMSPSPSSVFAVMARSRFLFALFARTMRRRSSLRRSDASAASVLRISPAASSSMVASIRAWTD